MGALAALKSRFTAWRRSAAARRELAAIGPQDRAALARDVGVPAEALERIAARGPDAAAGLPRLLRALGLDLRVLLRRDPALGRDLQLVCSSCLSTKSCARDLDAGRTRAVLGYCPNSSTLAALGAAPVAARGEPSWSMAKRVERRARLMSAMMERLGLDPAAAAREGGGAALAAASRRCLACGAVEECRTWLDGPADPKAPAFCPNGEVFERLRAGGTTKPAPSA